MKFFDIFKDKQPKVYAKKVYGKIGYYGLENWWYSELTEADRKLLLDEYNPLGSSSNSLVDGNIGIYTQSHAQSPINFLSILSSWVKDKELKLKILKKAESLVIDTTNVIDLHFLYIHLADSYKNPVETNHISIAYSFKLCEISSQVAQQMRIEYGNGPLPRNPGFATVYRQLMSLNSISDAIELVENALREGWRLGEIEVDASNKAKEHNIQFNPPSILELYTLEDINSDKYLTVDYYLELITEDKKKGLTIDNNAKALVKHLSKPFGAYKKAEALIEVGKAYNGLGDLKKASIYFNYIEQYCKELSSSNLSKFYRSIGDLYNENKSYPDALHWYKRGLEVSPKLGVKKLIEKLEKQAVIRDPIE